MPLSRRWATYKTDDLYRAWRAGRLSYNAFNEYDVSSAAEILSSIYCSSSGSGLGSAQRIEKDFRPQAIMKMLESLEPLVEAAEAGNGVFADEPEVKAPAEPQTDPRQETPEERAAEAELVQHPSDAPETLGRSCKGCAYYKPAGKPKGRGQCTNAYVKQPVAADWYCKHWKAAQAAPDGSRMKAVMTQVKARMTQTAVFDLDGTIISNPDTFPDFGDPNPEIVERMQRCLDAGLEVLVHSCRWSAELNDPELAASIKSEVESWLRVNNIPFTGLYPSDKPMAAFYCDDRGVHPSDLTRLDRLIDEAADRLKPEKDPGNPDVRAAEKPKHLPGSKHWNDPDDKYDAKALAQGVEIELEHTTDRELAKQIAKDHLSEDPKYYEKLKIVEAGLLFKAGDGKYWVTPDGKIFDVPHSHTSWIEERNDLWEPYDKSGALSSGLDAIDNEHDEQTINEQLFYQAEFVSQGWTRVDGDSIDTTAAKLKVAQNFARETWLKDDREKKIYVDFQGEGYFQGTVQEFVRLKTIKGALAIKASDGKFDWACLMIDYPTDLAQRVIAWGKDNVPDDVLYDPEADRSYGRESHVHTTVSYGIEPEVTASKIRETLGDRLGVVKAKLGKVTKFNSNPEYDVIKIDVVSADLHALHQAVEDLIGAPGNSFPEYKPHLTIAYVKPGSCDHLLESSPFEGEEFELSDFDFSDPSASHEKFSVAAKLAPLGVRIAAKTPFRGILFTAEPLLNRMAKLAKDKVESAPQFEGYVQDPAKAERLGAAQKALADARSEEELRVAWDGLGLGLSFDELKAEAEKLSE